MKKSMIFVFAGILAASASSFAGETMVCHVQPQNLISATQFVIQIDGDHVSGSVAMGTNLDAPTMSFDSDASKKSPFDVRGFSQGKNGISLSIGYDGHDHYSYDIILSGAVQKVHADEELDCVAPKELTVDLDCKITP